MIHEKEKTKKEKARLKCVGKKRSDRMKGVSGIFIIVLILIGLILAIFYTGGQAGTGGGGNTSVYNNITFVTQNYTQVINLTGGVRNSSYQCSGDNFYLWNITMTDSFLSGICLELIPTNYTFFKGTSDISTASTVYINMTGMNFKVNESEGIPIFIFASISGYNEGEPNFRLKRNGITIASARGMTGLSVNFHDISFSHIYTPTSTAEANYWVEWKTDANNIYNRPNTQPEQRQFGFYTIQLATS